MAITLEIRAISPYHFGLFLVSLGSTYAQSISSKAIFKLVNLPRQLRKHKHNVIIYITTAIKISIVSLRFEANSV
jgi:hypothetical protein